MNLYYDNMEMTSFDTTVLTCTVVNEKYHLTLKQTAFYPEKGGMAKDTGTLNGIQVIDLYEQDGKVVHVLPKSIAVGDKVHGEIDFLSRLRKCQIHTAQHIISYYLESQLPLMTISHHVGESSADIRLEWLLSENGTEKLAQLDLHKLKNDTNHFANEMIRNCVPINICYPDFEEYKEHQKKTNYSAADEVRVVKLGDQDYNFCGCIHVPNTSYIQMIHVLGIILTKTGLELEYQAGDVLRCDHDKRIMTMREAGVYLKQNEFEIMKGIETLQRQKEELEGNLRLVRQRCVDLYFNVLISEQDDILVAEYDSLSIKEGQMLASKLTAQNKIVYLLLRNDDSCHVIFASPKGSLHNMKEDYDRFTRAHTFKGGGNFNMAQGGGSYSASYQNEIRAMAQERKQRNDTKSL